MTTFISIFNATSITSADDAIKQVQNQTLAFIDQHPQPLEVVSATHSLTINQSQTATFYTFILSAIFKEE